MRVEVHGTSEAFLAAAGEFLARREAENNLIYGIADRVRETPAYYGEPPWFATVHDGASVVAAALRTPPWPVIVSRAPEPALAALVEVLKARGPLSGVVGPTGSALQCAGLWGAPVESTMDQLLYELTELKAPVGVPGKARQAGPADEKLLAEWILGFGRDVGEPVPGGDAVERARMYIRSGCAWLWVDGRPVSLAVWQGPTPRGVRISSVYTPPEFRRRGYAGAVTAAVTADRLASGRAYCFLFTDAANPTSNSVYRKLGYRQIGEFRRIRFRDPATKRVPEQSEVKP